MRLLVVSSVIHYSHGGRHYAYGPYTRELDIWADLFPQILIAAPCRHETPPGDCLPFTRPNVALLPQPETGGDTLKAKAQQILLLPLLISRLARAMRQADAIHVRCPSNLGLLGTVLAPLFSPHLIAKYAGQWNGYPEEPWTAGLQRWLLRSRWWRGPVTVYGQWPHQPEKVIPFFASILTVEQLARARAAATRPHRNNKLQILFVGRLSADKHVDTLLAALAQLGVDAARVNCRIVGEGEQRAVLERQAAELGVTQCVEFVGSVNFERVLDFYEQADVLVLASESEGWPKALVEGMAFGLICIGSARGLMPEMLSEGRGLIVPPGDATALAAALQSIIAAPERFQAMRARAAAWAQGYSLEGVREALRELLAAHWGVRLERQTPAPTPAERLSYEAPQRAAHH